MADYDFSVVPLVREVTSITYQTDFSHQTFSSVPIGQEPPSDEGIRTVPMLPRREP